MQGTSLITWDCYPRVKASWFGRGSWSHSGFLFARGERRWSLALLLAMALLLGLTMVNGGDPTTKAIEKETDGGHG